MINPKDNYLKLIQKIFILNIILILHERKYKCERRV